MSSKLEVEEKSLLWISFWELWDIVFVTTVPSLSLTTIYMCMFWGGPPPGDKVQWSESWWSQINIWDIKMKLRCSSAKREECRNLGGAGREATIGKWFGKTWVSLALLKPMGTYFWTTMKTTRKECQKDYYTWMKSSQVYACCGSHPLTAVQLDSVQFWILLKLMTLHLLFFNKPWWWIHFHGMKSLQEKFGLSVLPIHFFHICLTPELVHRFMSCSSMS